MNQIQIHNNLDISFQNRILISSAIVENFLKKYYSSWETFVETPFAFMTDFSLYNECMAENLSKVLDAFKMEYNPIENYDGFEKTTTNYGEHTTFNKQGSQLVENNYGETNNENIVFPNNLLEIGDYAFSNCSALKNEVDFNEQLKTIGDYAFFNCSKINKINFNNQNTKIGIGAFSGCSGLTE